VTSFFEDPFERLEVPGLVKKLHPPDAAIEHVKKPSHRALLVQSWAWCCRANSFTYLVNIGPVPFSCPLGSEPHLRVFFYVRPARVTCRS
jgi:hypothetical protein